MGDGRICSFLIWVLAGGGGTLHFFCAVAVDDIGEGEHQLLSGIE